LDDWAGGHPDAWDYEAVLREHEVTVDWCGKLQDGEGNVFDASPDLCGWGFSWKYGCIHIGPYTEVHARKAAAMFVSLWLRHVSASLCDKLMDGYLKHLAGHILAGRYRGCVLAGQPVSKKRRISPAPCYSFSGGTQLK
jgi:hypothetical protein